MSTRRNAAKSGIWSAVLQLSRFGLNTIFFLILARWLTLAEIGAFAAAFAPIRVLQIVQRSGFSEAIIQGDTDDSVFVTTCFWMALGFGFLASALLIVFSFFVGSLTNADEAGAFLLAMSAMPIMIAAASVPEGLLRRRFEVRSLAIRTTVSITLAGPVALWLGYRGYGGWALTVFALMNTALSTVLVLAMAKWRPKGRPRLEAARAILPIVGAISGREFAYSSISPIYQLMVAAALGPVAAGAFQIAQRFVMLAQTLTTTALRFATLPILVKLRDSETRLGAALLETSGLLTLVSAPVYFGLLSVAPQLLPLAVGVDNGLTTVPILQSMLFIGATISIHTLYTQALTATGRSDVALRWAIVSLLLYVPVGALAAQHSAALTALAQSALGFLTLPFVVVGMSRRFGLSAPALFRSAFAPVLSAALMMIILFAFNRYFNDYLGPLSMVLWQTLVGALVYLGLAVAFCREQLRTLTSLLISLRPSADAL
ncbi:MAG: oligosaccharide flippase family protein [Pseudomonadota bacterium]